ncbi:MAG: hypothetical protein DRO93_10625 [Candidatus Thorarchaeota archaeon]|nr:MAG: hypothetical protein DRO93_10625 [Candidatus Thorarchaeota archaeon]
MVTFGEVMLKPSPPNFMRIEQTHSFDAHAGGAEMNVAVACARLRLKAAYVTKLGNNSIGHFIRNQARMRGVDTSQMVWDPDSQCGVYFVELGAGPRTNRVIYDRKNSAISKIQPGKVPWDEIIRETMVFHTSGVTPALSPNCAEVTMEALRAARDAGRKASHDVNY